MHLALQSNPRILVAEDNAVNQRVAAANLKQLGCTVDIAENGREAVEFCAGCIYDAVFMDCEMPEMDGFEATREIRRREIERSSPLPIIALTTNADPGDRERCIDAGMVDYVRKPASPTQLYAVLIRWLPSDEVSECAPA